MIGGGGKIAFYSMVGGWIFGTAVIAILAYVAIMFSLCAFGVSVCP